MSVPFPKNESKRKSKNYSERFPIRPLNYLHLKRCESTQDLIQNVESGWFLLWSDRQEAGRGTRGRQWVSPPGGLYYSLAFPSPADADPIVLLGAASLWKSLLSDYYPSLAGNLSLKWPNDLLHDGRKLGGFLANKRSGMFYIGVGININNPVAEADADFRWPPISLVELLEERQNRRELLLEWYNRFYDAILRTGGNAFDPGDLEAEVSTIGRSVELDRGTGTAIGLGPNGELIVDIDGGTEMVHSADDVEVLMREVSG